MKNSLAKSTIWVIIVGLIAATTYWYITYSSQHPSTEDAYVEANTVQVAAQINGQIKQVFTSDHQHVSQNTLLLQIDPTPYQIAYDQALANLQSIKDNIKAGMSSINACKAVVNQRETSLELAKKNLDRSLKLSKKNMLSQIDIDKAKADYKSAQDALTAAQSKLEEAKQKVGADDQSNATLRVAQAQLQTAKWSLDNTKIFAPASGIISNFTTRVGDTVSAGRPLFRIVEGDQYWISANFKETDLQHIRVGQPVSIKIDMYPSKIFHGKIQSISPSSGASMALLPPENATGNWVKVTQRFPVRITINDKADPQHQLLIGASAKVTVDTVKTNIS